MVHQSVVPPHCTQLRHAWIVPVIRDHQQVQSQQDSRCIPIECADCGTDCTAAGTQQLHVPHTNAHHTTELTASDCIIRLSRCMKLTSASTALQLHTPSRKAALKQHTQMQQVPSTDRFALCTCWSFAASAAAALLQLVHPQQRGKCTCGKEDGAQRGCKMAPAGSMHMPRPTPTHTPP